MKFHLSDILTVTTGRFLSPSIDNVYKILNYMTADSIFTHQMPRVSQECAPAILEQHPELSAVSDNIHAFDDGLPADTDNAREYVNRFVARMAKKYGEELEILPLEDGGHERISPIAELAQMLEPKQ